MRINQCQSLGAESAEQREVRLLQVSTNQSERLAAESVEERECRRQCANERETHVIREQSFNALFK